MNIKNLLGVLVASAVLLVAPIIGTNSTALAADPAGYSLQVTGPEGLTVYFAAYGGSKQNQVVIYRSNGNGVKGSGGVYTAKLPSNFDPATLRNWCAVVMEPMEHFDKGIKECPKWGRIKAPDDGVYRSKLQL